MISQRQPTHIGKGDETMKPGYLNVTLTTLCILMLAAGGCTKPSPPTSFYMVGPLAAESAAVPTGPGEHTTVVVVETVKVSAYLDRNQIVTSLGDTEFALADFNHWAEPLSDTLTRVVAENLSRMLADQSVQVLPATRSIPFDRSVDVEVLRLDGRMNGQVTLEARWAIFGADERNLLHVRKSQYREAVGGDTYKKLVTAYSRAVEHLCRDIAASLKEVVAKP